MRALIVHESYFGNTRQLAEAMAAALQHSGHDATAVQADRATEELVRDADLLIVGAPTHAHSLPSARTRASTQQQGVAAAVATAPGVRELLDRLPAVPGLPAAAFDTRARMPRWLAGAASRPLAKRLGRLGYRMAVPPQSFFVRGTRGPLHAGEVERAADWAIGVAEMAAVRVRHAAA